jgi:phospholipid-binding lipoprotein MlaA
MASFTMKTLKNVLISASLLAMAACASVDKETGAINEDPYEDANRAVFAFNKAVDDFVLHPIASGYVSVVPEFGRDRVSNVLTNLKMPVIFINSLLQGNATNALSSFWSFVLNSTLGVAGIFDFTGANTTLKVSDEDFGQTLGVWGADQGAYIVLPLLGPSSSRDTVGFAADWVSDPFNYTNNTFVYTRAGVGAIDKRASLLNVLDEVYKTSLDPYATIRSAYLQQRRAAVKNTHEDVSR